MCNLKCKICGKEFRSVVIDKSISTIEAVNSLSTHAQKEHSGEIRELAMRIQQGFSLLPGVVFTNEFVDIARDSLNAEWIAEEFGKQQTQLAMICGFEWEEDEAEAEDEEDGPENENNENIITSN